MPVQLDLPSVLITPGPTYATKINAALGALAVASHTGGVTGSKWTAASLGIDADVSWGGYSITALKATVFTQQASIATANSLYFKTDNNLWCTNGSGTAIQLTSGGGLNASALIASIWPQLSVATNIVIGASDVYSHYKIDTSAARTITLPSAAAVGAGRFYIFTDHTGSAATNNITIQRAGSDTIFGVTSYAIASAFASAILVSDGVSAWSLAGGSIASQVLDNTLRSLADLTISAANNNSAGAGLPINIQGGVNAGAGPDGGVRLRVGTQSMIEAVEVATGQRVVALGRGSNLSPTEMPASSGDKVVYIGNSASPPTASPVGGFILHGNSGRPAFYTSGGVDVTLDFTTNAAESVVSGAGTALPGAPGTWIKVFVAGSEWWIPAWAT